MWRVLKHPVLQKEVDDQEEGGRDMQQLGMKPMNHGNGRSPGKDGPHYRQWRNYVKLLPPWGEKSEVTTARRALGRLAAPNSLSRRDAAEACLSASPRPSVRLSVGIQQLGSPLNGFP